MRAAVFFLGVATSALGQTAVERALDYLAAEVPKWRIENGCFSCHNNGDGARALYAARRFGAVATTSDWLRSPDEWRNAGDVAYSDKKLAWYQFAAALTAAVDAGAVPDRRALEEAARGLVAMQAPDGSWIVEDDGQAAGSPVTWGTTLATYFARRTLLAAGRHEEAVARAERWLRTARPRYTPDAAAVLLSFPRDSAIRKQIVERFAGTQTSDGGWGPRVHAAAEVFDTAIVLLALSQAGETQLIPRGRQFLLNMQQPAGGWPETTRPPGAQSYAQHISTTAWATMALLATDPQRE